MKTFSIDQQVGYIRGMESSRKQRTSSLNWSVESSRSDFFGAEYADIIEQAEKLDLAECNDGRTTKTSERERIIMASKKARLMIDSLHAEDELQVNEDEQKDILKRMTDRVSARLEVRRRSTNETRKKWNRPKRLDLASDFI